MGFDCTSPLKVVLGNPFKEVSDRLLAAIAQRYALPDWTADTHATHKHADCTAAASEALHCAGWTLENIREVLKITHPILDMDPLVDVYGCAPWEPWPAEVATERFLTEMTRLLSLVKTQQYDEIEHVVPAYAP